MRRSAARQAESRSGIGVAGAGRRLLGLHRRAAARGGPGRDSPPLLLLSTVRLGRGRRAAATCSRAGRKGSGRRR